MSKKFVSPLCERVGRWKARWLYRVMTTKGLGSTAKELAYFIADHLNAVTQDCWPAQKRLAILMDVSSKTVQRAAVRLSKRGLVDVIPPEQRNAPNRYAPVFIPDDTKDTNAPSGGQSRPAAADTSVCQSSSVILPESFPRGLANKRSAQPGRRDYPRAQQGALEQRVAKRLGGDGMEILEALHEVSMQAVEDLCAEEFHGALDQRALDAARLAARQLGRFSRQRAGGHNSRAFRARPAG